MQGAQPAEGSTASNLQSGTSLALEPSKLQPTSQQQQQQQPQLSLPTQLTQSNQQQVQQIDTLQQKLPQTQDTTQLTSSEVPDLHTATPPPGQISFTIASGGPASDLSAAGVSSQQLGLIGGGGTGLSASVLGVGGEATSSDPLGLVGVGAKSSIDFGDSDSEMTDGQSIQATGKPKRIRVSNEVHLLAS